MGWKWRVGWMCGKWSIPLLNMQMQSWQEYLFLYFIQNNFEHTFLVFSAIARSGPSSKPTGEYVSIRQGLKNVQRYIWVIKPRDAKGRRQMIWSCSGLLKKSWPKHPQKSVFPGMVRVSPRLCTGYIAYFRTLGFWHHQPSQPKKTQPLPHRIHRIYPPVGIIDSQFNSHQKPQWKQEN